MTVSDIPAITYSPALTVVPTYECFNRCSYCNFRVDPQADLWLSLADAEERLRQALSDGVIEVLVLSGEVHPQSPRRTTWFQRIYDLCELALNLGLLPHTNVGPLSYQEMARLKSVNASMGLMLEQITPALMTTVHHHAPSKAPRLRLQQLEQAGQLQIPFTTGLLLGIGESEADRMDTLTAIAACHDRWGHIQEVILQPHQPGTHQTKAHSALPVPDLISTITMARRSLPTDIVVQIPPNLVPHQHDLLAAIASGAQDLGGLGPCDEVNPDYPHPTIDSLAALLGSAGWDLHPRLPVYPQYDHWLPRPVQSRVRQWRQQLSQRTGRPSKSVISDQTLV